MRWDNRPHLLQGAEPTAAGLLPPGTTREQRCGCRGAAVAVGSLPPTAPHRSSTQHSAAPRGAASSDEGSFVPRSNRTDSSGRPAGGSAPFCRWGRSCEVTRKIGAELRAQREPPLRPSACPPTGAAGIWGCGRRIGGWVGGSESLGVRSGAGGCKPSRPWLGKNWASLGWGSRAAPTEPPAEPPHTAL